VGVCVYMLQFTLDRSSFFLDKRHIHACIHTYLQERVPFFAPFLDKQYIHTHILTCTHTYIHTCRSGSLSLLLSWTNRAQWHRNFLISEVRNVHMHVRAYIYIYIYVNVLYIYIYIYIYILMCVERAPRLVLHTHIHTYTHTHRHLHHLMARPPRVLPIHTYIHTHTHTRRHVHHLMARPPRVLPIHSILALQRQHPPPIHSKRPAPAPDHHRTHRDRLSWQARSHR
jgi:hypothetical protein